MDGPDLRTAITAPERLAAVEDSGLLDTPAEEPFDRLARLARRVLNTPLAFITVVDDQRSFWKSCIGVDGDVRQNTVEESFCQYVVASGRPLMAGDAATNPITRDNPSVESMGIGAWAGVPLRGPSGAVLGTFCVVDHEPRQWSSDDLTTLETLAEAASGEISLRSALQDVSTFAWTLQQSLLPPVLPEIEGIEVAAAYRPAGNGFGVLGDFYDLFETQPGRWVVCLGDVRGHGPEAVETAVTARWSIRASSARTRDPSLILGAVNNQLSRRPDPDAPHLTAILIAFSADPGVGSAEDPLLAITMSVAGHLPPLVVRRSGVQRFDPTGQPLGMFDQVKLVTEDLTLRPGETLLMFTDGVTEARRGRGAMFGTDGLVDMLEATDGPTSAQELVDLVISAVCEGGSELADDVAVLAVRLPADT